MLHYMLFSRYHKLPLDYTPDPKAVAAAQTKAGRKVSAITSMLRFFGRPKEALLLHRGFQTFATQNAVPYDKSLLCSVANSQALSAQLSAEEAELFPLVWSPELMTREQYGQYFLSGIRRLMLKQTAPAKLLDVNFQYIPDVAADEGLHPRLGADVAAGFAAGMAAAAAAVASPVSLVSPGVTDVVLRSSVSKDQQLVLEVAACSHSDCSGSDVGAASPRDSPRMVKAQQDTKSAPLPSLRMQACI